jgi:hypothetical protein
MIHDDSILTRRGILLFAAAGTSGSLLSLYAGESDFWNKKDPSLWSADEVDRLITKSPWAKEITASAPPSGNGSDRTGAGRSGGAGSGRGGLSVPGIGGIGLPGAGRGGGGMGGGRRNGPTAGNGGTTYKGVVRWESAKPVVEAMKTPLAGEFSNHYVISVSGIPVSSLNLQNSEETDADSRARQREREGVLDRIKSLTYLEPKGAASAQPGIVEETPFGVGETRTVLFGFSKTLLQLSLDDKEIVFTTQMGTTQVKAKFTLKEMMYHNELAV